MVLTTLFAALALGQQPSNTIIVTGDAQTGVKALTLAPDLAQDKKVSLKFDDASLKDVLNFLRKQKIDFVVDPDQYRDRKLSLNLNDVSTRTALESIASALDSHWETVNGVRILKKGAGFSSNFRTNSGTTFFAPGQFKGMEDMKGFQGQLFDKKAAAEMEKAMAEAQKAFAGQQFQFKALQGEEMKKAMDEARKAMAEAQKEMGNQQFQFKALQGDEMKKAMEEARKEMQAHQFEMKGLSGQQMEEVKKALGQAQKEIQGQKLEMKGLSDAQREQVKKALESARGQMELQRKNLGDLSGKNGNVFFLKGQNFGDLLKSITPSQKEIQKKQGYLKISDLTAEQKKMAGIKGEGTIEISITRDGETLKIKSQ